MAIFDAVLNDSQLEPIKANLDDKCSVVLRLMRIISQVNRCVRLATESGSACRGCYLGGEAEIWSAVAIRFGTVWSLAHTYSSP